MKTTIVGANGGIGRILSEQLAKEEGIHPLAMIRKSSQKDHFNSIGVETIMGDLKFSVGELSKLFKGSDAVVFTAGSGGETDYDKTLEIDLDGAVKCVEAAEKAGVDRFLMVSVIHADDREAWEQSPIKPYMIAKHYADRALKNSELNYIIFRPGSLTDDEGKGSITTKKDIAKMNSIPRADVASAISAALKENNSTGKIIDLLTGDTPIKEAVAGL